MKLAVITMVQRHEFPAAWTSLATVTSQLNDHRFRFILLNDTPDDELVARLNRLPYTSTLTPGENLGVARGRNVLIEAGLAVDADALVSLDDDLIVASDYLDRVDSRMNALALAGHRVGLIAPAVLDYVDSLVHDSNAQARAAAGEELPPLSTDQMRARLAQIFGGELPPTIAYHMGIKNWRQHYLYPSGNNSRVWRGLALDYLGVESTEAETEVRLTDIRNTVLETDPNPVAVDTLPGGVSVFTRDLVETIGLTEEAFSPFGYEDADFAIRSVEAGFQNFLVPSEIVLHDLQHRHRVRNTVRVAASVGKGRALLMRHSGLGTPIFEWVFDVMLLGASQSRVPLAGSLSRRGPAVLRHAMAYLAGLVVGLTTEVSTEAARSSQGSLWSGALAASELSGRIRLTRTPEGGRLIRCATDRLTLRPVRRLSVGGPLQQLSGMAAATIVESNGRIHVTSARLDFPGQIQVTCDLEIDGIDLGITGSDRQLREVSLRSFNLQIRDEGFLGRLESASGWRRGTPMRSQLQRLLNPPGSHPLSDAIHKFLSHRTRVSVFEISANPTTPVSLGMLADLEAQDDWGAFVKAINLTWITKDMADLPASAETAHCHT